MRRFLLGLLVSASLLAAPPPHKRRFTGIITDSMCSLADHSRMRMGPTDAECALACIEAHGAVYVLYDGHQAYTLSDQHAPEKLVGKRVTVTGALDVKTNTLKVDSLTPAR